MTDVFADRLQVTVDRMAYRDLRDRLLPILDTVGAAPDYDKPVEESGLWRTASGGTLHAKRWCDVVSIGASGQLLAMLRAASLFGGFLQVIATEPHKVTCLDATMDVYTDAPPVVAEFYARARTPPGIRLTRKSIPARHVTAFMGTRDDGRESGTVYVGGRSADVRLKVYDKQHEQAGRGIQVPPCVRYELTLRAGKVTLKDVFTPAPVFWAHMQAVLPRPEGVPAWCPGESGFVVQHPAPLSILERLRKRLVFSDDIAALVRLADQIPDGRSVLQFELGRAYPLPV